MNSYSHLANLYDGFMSDVDYRSWASYVSRLYRRALGLGETEPFLRAQRLLECGCGTGNITVPLAKMGYELTASDISDDMLAVASEKARALGVKLPFVRMDMRDISFHRPLDGVIACCDCVNYLLGEDDVRKFLISAYKTLKPGGVLLFDISSKYKLESILGNNAFTDSREDMAYFWQNTYDEASQLIEMELEFFKKTEAVRGDVPLYERSRESHVQRAHSKEELVSLLMEAGYSRIETFDAFTLEPENETSERIQFLAVR